MIDDPVGFIKIPASKGGKMVQGAVTFLDVLGWKGIWARGKYNTNTPIYDLQDIVKKAQEKRNKLIETCIEYSEQRKEQSKIRGMAPDKAVRIESISDTIVILSGRLTTDNVRTSLWVHAELCKTIICESIKSKIPVRGATCYGDYIASDDRIMIGPAIDEAASWHEMTEWIGVIKTPRTYIISELYKDDGWIKGIPPLKGSVLKDFKEMHCVNWVKEWSAFYGSTAEERLRSVFSEMGPLDPTIAQKYLNTLKFFKEQTER